MTSCCVRRAEGVTRIPLRIPRKYCIFSSYGAPLNAKRSVTFYLADACLGHTVPTTAGSREWDWMMQANLCNTPHNVANEQRAKRLACIGQLPLRNAVVEATGSRLVKRTCFPHAKRHVLPSDLNRERKEGEGHEKKMAAWVCLLV
jgi:hypothetical protein